MTRHLPIAVRLAVAFGLLLALLAGVILHALQQTARVAVSTRQLATTSLHQVVLAGQAQQAAQTAAGDLHALFLVAARDQRVPVYAHMDAQTARYRQILDALLAQPDTAAGARAVIDEVSRTRSAFTAAFNRTVDEIELDGAGEGSRGMMVNDTTPALNAMLAALQRLVDHQTAQANSTLAEIATLEADSRRSTALLGMVAVLLAVLSAVVITRSIARPLAEAGALAREVADGRLDSPLPERAADEVGQLVGALDQMRQGIARREARITELAYRDGLTGLANRTLYTDRLTNAVALAGRSGLPLAVLLMDLDRFKAVNDSLGHPGGDELLKQVALRLQAALPRSSDTLARIGGDEFAVLLTNVDAAGATLVARRLMAALEEPLTLHGQSVDVSASLGLACHPHDGSSAAELLARADTAMYAAKQSGSGYAQFDPAMAAASEHGLSLLSELRRAVDHGELFLMYQPKVRLGGRHGGTQDEGHDGHHAAEVLLRWRHPQRGLVPPDQFITFAERTGFIRSLTRWVAEEACRQLAQWQAEGLDVHLNINISTRDLIQQDLPGFMSRLLADTGIAARRLCLEVTESAIMDDPEHALESLQALHAMGLGLSIDDFGTGYSSLAYLKRLPVQELKIDRSFVRNLAHDDSDALIVRSTIELAHNFGLRVVAEGVEDEVVHQRLRAWGCDQAQGYLFSRPLPAADFRDWVQARNEAKVDALV